MTNDDAMVSAEVQEKLLDIFAKLEDESKTAQDQAEVIFFAAEAKKAPLYKEARPLLKQVPDFWLLTFDVLALHPHKIGREEIEVERPIMEHIEDVALELDPKTPHSSGKLIFYFSNNKFLKDKELALEWSGMNTEDFKVVHPKISWFKPITSLKNGFFAWLTNVKDENMIQDIVLELYPNAISRYFGGEDSDEEMDGLLNGSDESGSEDIDSDEAGSDGEEEKPAKKGAPPKKEEQKKKANESKQEAPKKGARKQPDETAKPTKKRKN